MKLSTNVTDDTLSLTAAPAGQKSHHLKFLYNGRKQKKTLFLWDKRIPAAASVCELRWSGTS